jgi:hypothetical protein
LLAASPRQDAAEKVFVEEELIFENVLEAVIQREIWEDVVTKYVIGQFTKAHIICGLT